MHSENPYQAPQVEVEPAGWRSIPPRHTLSWMLFSFKGRIPRRVFWGVNFLSFFVYYVAATILEDLVFFDEDSMPENPGILGLYMALIWLPLVWISLAVAAKRWHDRDKSGWWILIQRIPIVGPIWAFIETGCLRGTVGSNQYGEDPT